jgi:hypothetical protein
MRIKVEFDNDRQFQIYRIIFLVLMLFVYLFWGYGEVGAWILVFDVFVWAPFGPNILRLFRI